jgi:hypothetical protein
MAIDMALAFLVDDDMLVATTQALVWTTKFKTLTIYCVP